MRSLCLGVVVLTCFASQLATAFDVVAENNKLEISFIKVESSGDSVRFKLCDLNQVSCIQIGKQAVYSISELQQKRKVEFHRAAVKGAVDLTVVLATGGAGIFVALETCGISATAAAGIGAAAPTLVYGISKVRAINPVYNLHRAQKLDDKVLKGDKVSVASVSAFAAELEDVLNN